MIMASKTSKKVERESRKLRDLTSVGPATIRDLELLGIRSVAQLRTKDPVKMYDSLCRVAGVRHDICCLDVFQAAVAQAKNPQLPKKECNWWHWSKVRKSKDNQEKQPKTFL